MGLFYNYKKSGKGISKQGPQKRAFFAFMEIFTGKFWKLLVLNLLYAAFCIPIVTFGPATAALTHVMRKFVLGQPIFVFHEFWTAFKKNFRQSFIMGLLDLVFIALCLYIIPFYDALLRTNLTTENTVLIIVTLSFIMYYIIMHFYIYLQIVALNLSLSAIIKNSIMLTVLGIKRNFINLLFILGFAFLFYICFPYSVLVLPVIPAAWMCLINAFICYPVIQKHIIIPYYESRGEKNPEIPDWAVTEDTVFEDKGGTEDEVHIVTKPKGKIIR